MAAKLFFYSSLIIFTLSFAQISWAQTQTCRWTYNRDNGSCQQIFGNDGKKWITDTKCDTKTKGKYDNLCCCQDQTSKKYLVIASVFGFFLIATIYYLIVKG